VRQNPIQRTVSLFICVCIALCTTVAHNIAQNRPDSFPSYPLDNHHISDDVYLREGRPAGWSVCLPLLIFPCTIKSRSSLLAPAHPGGPGKGGVKWLWLWCGSAFVDDFTTGPLNWLVKIQ